MKSKIGLKTFFKLSRDISYAIRTGFGVSFQPPNDFEVTFIVFKKYPFFDEKTRGAFLDLIGHSLTKPYFFFKKSIFSKTIKVSLKSFEW